jgi:DNA gyrase subunit A
MGIDINQEIHDNFIDYAYEVNSQRAFPSAIDGLKPGQRACLWEFYTKGYSSNKPHVKSAKAAGGIIGSWWPHGDVAIYETFARMSQPWINNIPEINWHGANGSVKGGPEPASSRYTEARLSTAAEDGFFTNIKKDVVNMIPNFSEDDEWPEVLPAIFPRLFVNGSQGIGYTIANSWLPGNLGEFYTKVKEYCKNGIITYDNIYPDFPSGGIIINKDELKEIYLTGKGKAIVRAKTEIDGNSILITELPYQVYVEPLINSIKDLVNKEEITGIKDIYNKCDKNNLLIEIECDGSPKVILNKLFNMTELQKAYSANQYAMITKVPELLNLEKYIQVYVENNIQWIVNEYTFDLNKAEARLEIVNGLLKALTEIDKIIATIKQSESEAKAEQALIALGYTDAQAKAITDMRLGKLAHLEGVALEKEAEELNDTKAKCATIIESSDAQTKEFLNRLGAFVKKYGYARHTQVIQIEQTSDEEKEVVDVEPEQCMVVLSESGYIKRIPITSFRAQRKNGVGIKTQDDVTLATIRTNTIDKLLVFTNKGMLYRLLVNDIPVGNNSAKGTSIKALIDMDANENVETIYSVYRNTDAQFVVFVTKNGLVKKTPLAEYVGTRKKNGLSALKLKDDDTLVNVTILKDEDILIASSGGKIIRLKTADIGVASRTSMGIKGITLDDGEYVVSMATIRDARDDVALFTSHGFGKRVPITEFNPQKRGGKGIYGYKPDELRGGLAALAMVNDEDILLVVGENASLCINCNTIPVTSRAGKGAALIKGNSLVSVSKI